MLPVIWQRAVVNGSVDEIESLKVNKNDHSQEDRRRWISFFDKNPKKGKILLDI